MIAAMEKNIPVYAPGAEDSTLGNAFVAACMRGELQHITTMRSGYEYMVHLAAWWAEKAKKRKMGFTQVGGGVAGDFAICVVPMLNLELGRDDLPLLSYFMQCTDAVSSYGGYSGALPTEKGSWAKVDEKTETFAIDSDATIVMPLIFSLVLGE